VEIDLTAGRRRQSTGNVAPAMLCWRRIRGFDRRVATPRGEAMAYNDFTQFFYTVDPATLSCEPHRELMRYWDTKRGNRRFPRRADIDPLELRSHLGHLFLIDVLPGGEDYRFRLLGSAMTQRYGRDSTGKTISEAYAAAPEIGAWILKIFAAVVVDKAPVVSEGRLSVVGKSFVIARALQLPLSDDDHAVTMILGEMRFFDADGSME
jgi:hypothetical protein